MDEFEQLLAQQAAFAEQRKASIADTANLLGEFRKHLILQGFNAEEAFECCRDYLNALFDANMDHDENS